MPLLVSNATLVVIAAMITVVVMAGILVVVQQRRMHKRAVQDVAARLDEEFGVKDETRFKSLDSEFDPQDAREIWLHDNERDHL